MNDVRDAYHAAGGAWRTRPEQVYGHLAEALLDRSPIELRGARVLDVGAGTGVGARAALRRGAASVVLTDLASGMLGSQVHPAVIADAVALPFGDDSFDLVLECFVLGHLPDPSTGLVEASRVGRALLVSAFALDWAHPAKARIDETMAGFGFELPAWYRHIKAGEDLVADPGSLHSLAVGAGYADVEVARVEVDVGVDDPAAMVEWRWGMAHLAPFVATLPDDVRERAREACEAAVVGVPPVVVPMLALAAGPG